jgi:hypothetical protein
LLSGILVNTSKALDLAPSTRLVNALQNGSNDNALLHNALWTRSGDVIIYTFPVRMGSEKIGNGYFALALTVSMLLCFTKMALVPKRIKIRCFLLYYSNGMTNNRKEWFDRWNL